MQTKKKNRAETRVHALHFLAFFFSSFSFCSLSLTTTQQKLSIQVKYLTTNLHHYQQRSLYWQNFMTMHLAFLVVFDFLLLNFILVYWKKLHPSMICHLAFYSGSWRIPCSQPFIFVTACPSTQQSLCAKWKVCAREENTLFKMTYKWRVYYIVRNIYVGSWVGYASLIIMIIIWWHSFASIFIYWKNDKNIFRLFFFFIFVFLLPLHTRFILCDALTGCFCVLYKWFLRRSKQCRYCCSLLIIKKHPNTLHKIFYAEFLKYTKTFKAMFSSSIFEISGYGIFSQSLV